MNKAKTKQVFIWENKSTWVDAKTDFSSHFSHIRGYHCCRTIDVKTFYKDGFMLPSKEKLLENTLLVLKNGGKSQECLEQEFEKFWNEKWETDYKNPKIFFGLHKGFLLDYCGHYLIYGSELICSIARKLNIDSIIKQQGKPTIFSVDIPIEQINDRDILDLKNTIKEFCKYEKPPEIDFTVFTTKPICPYLIVDCEHPNKIPDPLNNFRIYSFNEA